MSTRCIVITLAMIVSVLIVGCRGTESTTAPTPVPPTATCTPVPPPATFTPVPPTATQQEAELAVQTINKIGLEVIQDYPNIEEAFSLPIRATVQRTLTGTGYSIVTAGADCEGVLTIEVIGTALGADYAGAPHTCYTGVEISGQVSLTIGDDAPLIQPISVRKPTTKGVILRCPNKTEAPFGRNWPKAVYGGISELLGMNVLLQALNDEEIEISCAAAGFIGDYGSEAKMAIPRILEIWIGELDDGSAIELCAESYAALKKITGQDFGYSEEKWLEWWEENK